MIDTFETNKHLIKCDECGKEQRDEYPGKDPKTDSGYWDRLGQDRKKAGWVIMKMKDGYKDYCKDCKGSKTDIFGYKGDDKYFDNK